MLPAIHPPALKKGDTLALVAPASVPNPDRMDRARALLESEGFQVKIYGELYQTRGYLAGDDSARAAALMDAFCDEKVHGILCARGGYGCPRILDRLDYQAIRSHPKVLVGFSDITALHLAIQKKTGLITFHGPHPNDGLGKLEGWDARSARGFWRVVMGSEAQTGKTDESPPACELPGDLLGDTDHLRTLVAGSAQGRLIGGNLAVLVGLMGTPYEIETGGAILFLEDVDEAPYRIDRYLAQLRLGGKFNHLSGLVLGQFTNCVPNSSDPSLSLEDVFVDYFTNLDIPVLCGFPAGHDCPNLTLPLNAVVNMDASEKKITLLDSHSGSDFKY
ncbi:MAG: LD-carboxypeptidase [Pirellulales bacterium]|nr:LD-carboxypeptidase [Pirellulales bacterium]